MEEIIQTQKLTRRYGNVLAVDDISLSVNKGEIYGFLGLNGAGKTTIIRMLLGMIRPSSGNACLYGKKVDAGNHDLWKRVGCLVETPYAYPTFTVRENLEMIRRMRRISDKNSVDEVMEKLELTSYGEIKAKNLSLGNAQKLGVAKALIHNPDILILDEPTNGLDPAGIVEVRELLQNLVCTHGVTIFISSHILEEMSKLATRIGIIHQGRLLQEISRKELEDTRHKRLHISVNNKEAARTMLLGKGYTLQSTGGEILEITGEKAIKHPEEIARILVEVGLSITMLKIEEENLESYFLRTIGLNGGDTR